MSVIPRHSTVRVVDNGIGVQIREEVYTSSEGIRVVVDIGIIISKSFIETRVTMSKILINSYFLGYRTHGLLPQQDSHRREDDQGRSHMVGEQWDMGTTVSHPIKLYNFCHLRFDRLRITFMFYTWMESWFDIDPSNADRIIGVSKRPKAWGLCPCVTLFRVCPKHVQEGLRVVCRDRSRLWYHVDGRYYRCMRWAKIRKDKSKHRQTSYGLMDDVLGSRVDQPIVLD